MALSVVMPALEMAQETGKLLAWRKKEGDRVRKGELLLEIETDKAVVEIESPGEGILAAVRAREGAVVPVGQTIAWLLQPGEAVPADSGTQTERTRATAPATESAAAAAGIAGDSRVGAELARSAPTTTGGQIRISPKARRLAQERGVDLTTVKGSGPGGEILAEDILALAASERHASTPEGRAEAGLSTTARLMAERTTRSWTTVPHFFLQRDVDADALNAAREKSSGATHTDLLVALVARALVRHPRMNASWIDGAIQSNPEVNVAIAIAIEDAVVAGVVHGADRLSLAQIGERRKELADRARAGKLRPADITGATFTISNLGMYQVDAFTAIIVPPQAGILAVGAIADRVVAVNGTPAVRPMLTITLSCDHRVIDGARAAVFFADLVDAIRSCSASLSGERPPLG
jgi:pyruvate dehydrogenase E2 component (dihydrolipoamide acetyltransferase)